jgi:2-isopropylmalate synthase
LAVANTLRAIEAGATQVQGTMNGGERVGNLDILSLMLIRTLKQGIQDIPSEQLIFVKSASDEIRALAGLAPDPKRPFVGDDAAAHKAGLHAQGIRLNPRAYQHYVPEMIGNHSRVIISELSGRNNIEIKLEELRFPLPVTADFSSTLTTKVKEHTAKGYDYTEADASFEMLARRLHPQYEAPYDLRIGKDKEEQTTAELHLKEPSKPAGEVFLLPLSSDPERTFSQMQKVLSSFFPHLAQVELVSCSTRPENGHLRTVAHVRDKEKSWTTVGANTDPQVAGLEAIHDALEYAVYHPTS